MSFEKLQADCTKRKIYSNMILFIKLYGQYNIWPDTEKGDCDYMSHVFYGIGDYIKRNKRIKRLLIQFIDEYGREWGEPVRNRITKSLMNNFGVLIS
jgi:hypothetical protein